jgi:hypothetical protein
MKTRIFAIFCLVLGFRAFSAEVGNVQITFRVTDDFGKPLPGITVMAFAVRQKLLLLPLTIGNAEKKKTEAVTDTNGTAVIKISSVLDGRVSYGIAPVDGYYYTAGDEYHFKKVEYGRWQPWNPTVEMVLKPILNPVPMYAENTPWSLTLPEIGKPIGYDLMVGDWVAPYGKGITNDFIFTLNRQFTNVNAAFSATLRLAFSNDGDGIQSILATPHVGSDLRLPRFAPETNYESRLVLRMYQEPGKPMVGVLPKENQNYFFRVRTVSKDGQAISALYGKIYGGIGYDIFHSPTAQIGFTYYLNPEPNSRNMEFNTKSNLFKNLSSLEKVHAP